MTTLKDIRKHFPIYQSKEAIIYLDSAASSLKVDSVIAASTAYDQNYGVNVHRGSYQLTHEATELYEDARQTVADFIGASPEEIIFTRGTTTSLNMVANSYRQILKPGDEIIVSELEHHSSLLPWMVAAKQTGAILRYIPLTSEGRITAKAFESVLTQQTKVVAVTYVSNVLGYQTPVEDIVALAHQQNAVVILDAAQALPHLQVDVKKIDADFLAFSGHKMFGPTGVGVLYGKSEQLKKLTPFEFGGEMADLVYLDHFTFKEAPSGFEAGTPVISAAIGLGEAVRFIKGIGYDTMEAHVRALHQYLLKALKKIPEIKIYNETAEHAIIAFNVEEIHPHDISTYLSEKAVSIRAGHHCAQLVSKFLNVSATLRASLHIYNTKADCDRFVAALKEAIQFFQKF